MKFYNPFKPHTCQLADGKFAIRKLSLLVGWVFFNQTGDEQYWWSTPCWVIEYCTVNDPKNLKYPTGTALGAKYVKQI